MVQGLEQKGISSGLGESISASVDGEVNDLDLNRLLRDASDERVRESWRNYHLIGASLRGELDENSSMDISASVFAALENEAPLQPVKERSQIKSMLNGFGKTAIAASVALAVLVGVQYTPSVQDAGEPLTAEVEPLPEVQNAEVVPAGFQAPRVNARVVSTNPNSQGSVNNYSKAPFVVPESQAARSASDPELQAYLNRLLLIHAEQSSKASVIGVLPYARVLYPDQEK